MPIHADARVLVFTAAVVAGHRARGRLAPALRLARSNVTDAIKQGGRAATPTPAGSRVRSALVVVEVALSLVLLVGAGLMIRSLWLLNTVGPGFRRARTC